MARWLLSSSFPAGVGVGRWQQQVGDDGLSGEEIVATSDGGGCGKLQRRWGRRWWWRMVGEDNDLRRMVVAA